MRKMQISVIVSAAMLAWATAAAQEEPKQPTSKPTIGVKVLRDLQYVEDGHERHRLDLYLPEKAEGRLPVVVWIHGGAWMAGSKEGCPAAPFASQGCAVASINYRLSQHAVFPPKSKTARRPSVGYGRTPPSIISIPTTSAFGARWPAAIWSPCSAPRPA